MNDDESSEFIVFSDDPQPAELSAVTIAPKHAQPRKPWRILIVDDDADVHTATEFALAGLDILDHPLQFLHAYSAAEAIALLMRETDVAVILLDVVMEHEDAGLTTVSTIREELGLTSVQIILRTGQPGYAPELETIRRYDINDYRTKSELSRVKLYTALTASIRAYSQLCRLDNARQGLERVVHIGTAVLGQKSPTAAFASILEHAAGLLGAGSGGLLLVPDDPLTGTFRVAAATGEYARWLGMTSAELASPLRETVQQGLTRAVQAADIQLDVDATTLYFPGGADNVFLAYLPTPGHVARDRQLLRVFCANAAVCAQNLHLIERLRDIAYRDPLTGMATRRAFIADLDRRLAGGARDNLAILLFDIDQFAEINDMFGHQYGDLVLKGIARRLREALTGDILVARLGADNFAILGAPAELDPVPMRKLLAQPFVFDGEERLVSVASSFVNATDAETGADANALLKDASIVMKRAKANGLGRHITYTPQFHTETLAHSRTLHELGLAFRHEELFLMFQPQVALADGRVIGMEALLRWRRADGRLIGPDTFIPIAEKSGLIVPIGQWVLTKALEAVASLNAAGYSDLRMAVNVSPPQLASETFIAQLDEALAVSGIAPAQLELEVTESVAILGFDEVYARLNAIRSRGIALAIDDFGTGYSSLSYLDQLPADRLKIDRAFVAALSKPSAGPRIAELVIPLGHQLQMNVLAEGVETRDQADMLLAMGCDEAQGFLFARPMILPDLLGWLAQRG